jgi:HD superfamily phosphohydrolase
MHQRLKEGLSLATKEFHWLDPLYGEVSLTGDVVDLTAAPIAQRMRHVRLSNIDALDLPSISSLTRYEHVLGVCYLAQNLPLRAKLPEANLIALDAAALLHDWAITAYGHLVEEALQFANTGFDHEARLNQLVGGGATDDTGGLIYHQVLHGRDSGLMRWAQRLHPDSQFHDELIRRIGRYVVGEGSCGKIISSSIDIDNIDNVYRVAYHLGLYANYEDPLNLARAIVDVDADSKNPVFSRDAAEQIERWLDVRQRVYSYLMLGEKDFAGKVMMLYATVHAFRSGELSQADWRLTDDEFKHKLVNSPTEHVRNAAVRWSLGEIWDMSPMFWIRGARPAFSDLAEFSDELSGMLRRTCFCYGIKDKRQRQLDVMFDDGSRHSFGQKADRWLFAFGSSKRKELTIPEIEVAIRALAEKFGVEALGRVEGRRSARQETAWLI